MQWWTSINNNNYFNPKDYEDPKNIYNNILDINILDSIEDKMTRGVAKKAFVISQKQNLSLDEPGRFRRQANFLPNPFSGALEKRSG